MLNVVFECLSSYLRCAMDHSLDRVIFTSASDNLLSRPSSGTGNLHRSISKNKNQMKSSVACGQCVIETSQWGSLGFGGKHEIVIFDCVCTVCILRTRLEIESLLGTRSI